MRHSHNHGVTAPVAGIYIPYTPPMPVEQRDRLYRGWQEAVRRSRAWATVAST